MPRPKGSKNKKPVIIENVDEKIAAVEAEIAQLTGTIKEKKAELRTLTKAKAQLAKKEAEKKAAEEKAVIFDAVQKSGKTAEEILAFLKD